MTTQCIEHPVQRSFWASLKLHWTKKHTSQLERQLQARATLQHLPKHMQRDIGLHNEDHTPSLRSNWW